MATLEAQGWKQEAADAKAAVSPTLSFWHHGLYSSDWDFIAGTGRTEGICFGLYSVVNEELIKRHRSLTKQSRIMKQLLNSGGKSVN